MTPWALLYYLYDLSSFCIRVFMLFYLPLKHSPTTATSWLLAVYLWPWPVAVLYAVFGSTSLPAERALRHEKLLSSIEKDSMSFRTLVQVPRPDLPEDLCRFAGLGRTMSNMNVTGGNDFKIFTENEDFLSQLAGDIETSQTSVNLLYYIFSLNKVTEPLFAALERAAGRGVSCRLLVDAVGSKKFLKRAAKRLREKGVRVEMALEPRIFRKSPITARYDLRNHRKIAVIDGLVGYTGSHNVIDCAYDGKAKGRQWHDLTLRLTGPVVSQLQGVFTEDWYVETGELLSIEGNFPTPLRTGNAVIQSVPSGPSYPLQNYQRLVVSALHRARKRIVITTPYLIPDDELLHALETATLSGVKVQLLVPERGDQFIVGSAAKAYYDELLAMGVAIHLYPDGILHSKTMTVDDDLAFVGTSNFDIRSFALNFEINLVLYGFVETEAIRSVQRDYLTCSRRLTSEEWGELPSYRRAVYGIMKLFSPLL